MNEKIVKVVAGVIYYEPTEEILIARRIKGDEGAAGKWEFPGGKIESGENINESIKRELKEEFSLEITPIKTITTTQTKYPTRTIEIVFIHCTCNKKELEMNTYDHSEYKWIKKEELIKYEFAKADEAFIDFYLKKG